MALWANARGHRFFVKGVSGAKKAAAVLVLPALFSGLAWIGVVFGMGALVTQIFGGNVAVDVIASKAYSPSRRFCDYRLLPQLPSPSSLEICMTAEEYGRLQVGSAITLEGTQTMLGLYVAGWKPANKVVNMDAQGRLPLRGS
ncbi:hypothetical protein [Ramlibacter tataouinensis]|uniref:hypothetical protein n=1 Tax=Ramlibacter tataouinensis TaxID=94132 RepID=UPI001180E606|nr:hypothetical protein [Ramlibacter tataouinensis]